MSSAVIDPTELRLRVSYRLQSERLRTFPFEHFFIDQLFDREISGNIREYWPCPESFDSIASTKRVSAGAYKQRKIISLEEYVGAGSGDSPTKSFWKTFHKAFGGDEFLSEIINWLWPSIRSVRELPDTINLASEIVLTDDEVGYALTPHTDAPSRLVTILFFVPENGNSEFAGTSLYVRKDNSVPGKISAVHQPRDQFDRVFTAPFRPDSALGFIVGPTSYHGVEPLRELPTSRRQIQYCIRWTEA
jgi:hypothetical protein